MANIVLAAVDLHDREQDREIVRRAAGLAAVDKAKFHLAHVVPTPGSSFILPYVPEDRKADVQAEARHGLEKLGEAIKDTVEVAGTHVLEGTVYAAVLDLAKSLNADLIVIGAHRPQLVDFLLGPNSARIARHASCSVYIVR